MPYYKNHRNLEIYFEVINGGENRFPLIFVHGYGSSLNMFHHQIEQLKPYFQLILIDAEGHGKSDKADSEIKGNLLKI